MMHLQHMRRRTVQLQRLPWSLQTGHALPMVTALGTVMALANALALVAHAVAKD